MLIDLQAELDASGRQGRPGAPRLREYARLAGQLVRLRDKASLVTVRHGLNQAIRKVLRQAGHERRRR